MIRAGSAKCRARMRAVPWAAKRFQSIPSANQFCLLLSPLSHKNYSHSSDPMTICRDYFRNVFPAAEVLLRTGIIAMRCESGTGSPAPASTSLHTRSRNVKLVGRWAHSSVGRALQWHCRGRRFDPVWVHKGLSNQAFSIEGSSEQPYQRRS